jgi:hypothetical protein
VPDVSRLKTDVFRERSEYSSGIQEQLARARELGGAAVRHIENSLQMTDAESGVLVDLLLSFRAVSAHDDMIRVVEALPSEVAATTLVQEQYAFALNRVDRDDEAERLLTVLIRERGANSETYGLLGSVYKRRWMRAIASGSTMLARGVLEQAIEAYLKGFEADWRDHYPGVNAVQLMALREPVDPRFSELLPVVRYSARRRLEGDAADYWDRATLLELAVLDRQEAEVASLLPPAAAALREPWEARSTIETLRRLRLHRERSGEHLPWADEVEQVLEHAAHRREQRASS